MKPAETSIPGIERLEKPALVGGLAALVLCVVMGFGNPAPIPSCPALLPGVEANERLRNKGTEDWFSPLRPAVAQAVCKGSGVHAALVADYECHVSFVMKMKRCQIAV